MELAWQIAAAGQHLCNHLLSRQGRIGLGLEQAQHGVRAECLGLETLKARGLGEIEHGEGRHHARGQIDGKGMRGRDPDVVEAGRQEVDLLHLAQKLVPL